MDYFAQAAQTVEKATTSSADFILGLSIGQTMVAAVLVVVAIGVAVWAYNRNK